MHISPAPESGRMGARKRTAPQGRKRRPRTIRAVRCRTIALLWGLLSWSMSIAAAGTINGFDVTDSLIPQEEIRSGGPPRDGIPAIDDPHFIAPEKALFMRGNDPVVSVTIGGTTRAYPLRILVWHEIVNDTIGDRPIAVTYCPLCGTAMVFDRKIGGRTLSFGVSGLLYQSDVLMYDRQTESLWSQLAMKSVSGPMKGEQLRWLPSAHMSWRAWRERYPEGVVLSTDTGFRRNYADSPYDGYEETEATIFPVQRHRKELRNKEWVAGLVLDKHAKAYRLRSLPDGEEIEDDIGGVPIRVRYDRRSRLFIAKRSDTGEVLPSVQAFWFAWQAFYPQTGLMK